MHSVHPSTQCKPAKSPCRTLALTTAADSQRLRWGSSTSRQRKRCLTRSSQALPNLKVVGVGGVASRMVGQLWDNEALENVEVCIINTDVQELSCTFMPDQDKLLIGASTTKWAGTRGNARLGQEAAEESSGDISRALEGADMVLLLVGMGGGTGRGAAPVVADIARQQGAFTMGIALVPQQQEGTSLQSNEVLASLRATADGLVPVYCTASSNGSRHSAEELPISCLVQGIADLLLGVCSVAPEAVHLTVEGGNSTLAFAVAKGPGRVTRAVFAAISTRECQAVLEQACGVLCFIAGAETDDPEVDDVLDILHSQCSSAHTMLMRTLPDGMPAGLPPGTVAVTVLITTPARQYLASVDFDPEADTTDLDGLEQQSEDGPASGSNVQQDGGSVPQAGNTGADVRHLADVADAAAVQDGDGIESQPPAEQVPEEAPARDGMHEEGS